MLYLEVASKELKPGDLSLPFLVVNHMECFQQSILKLGYVL